MKLAEHLTKKPENSLAELNEERYDWAYKDTDYQNIINKIILKSVTELLKA